MLKSSYLAGKNEDASLNIAKDDILLTAATQNLLQLIDDLDNCTTTDELDTILDDENNQMLISSGHWPVEILITLKNKGLK